MPVMVFAKGDVIITVATVRVQPAKPPQELLLIQIVPLELIVLPALVFPVIVLLVKIVHLGLVVLIYQLILRRRRVPDVIIAMDPVLVWLVVIL